MAELERVLYAQMLILFAPHAGSPIHHVPLLLGNLRSRQPALRKAAADTLRHLAGAAWLASSLPARFSCSNIRNGSLELCLRAERDPAALLPSEIELTLFSALDNETDGATAAQLKATLRTLLAAGSAARPSHYLAVCTSVILAANATASAPQQPNGVQSSTLEGKTRLHSLCVLPRFARALLLTLAFILSEDRDSEGDDEDDESATRKGPTADSRNRGEGTASSAPGAAPTGAVPGAKATTRLRTRTFAARCLLRLPDLVASDRRHLDSLMAQVRHRAVKLSSLIQKQLAWNLRSRIWQRQGFE